MPFDMYSDVILTLDVTEHRLRAGDVGTVVERHIVPGVAEEGYSVEFFDMTGNTVGVTPFYGFGEEDVAYPEKGFFPSFGLSLGYSF